MSPWLLVLETIKLLKYTDFKCLVAFETIPRTLVNEFWLNIVQKAIAKWPCKISSMRSRNNFLTRVENDTGNVRPVCSFLSTLVDFNLCHFAQIYTQNILIEAITTSNPNAIRANHIRLHVFRSEQAEWQVVRGFMSVFMVVPVLEFSQGEIFRKSCREMGSFLSLNHEIISDRPLHETILRTW